VREKSFQIRSLIAQKESVSGIDHHSANIFSYLSPEQRMRKAHPLRAVTVVTDEILMAKSTLFNAMYASGGRPSTLPGLVTECHNMKVTPHVAQNTARAGRNTIDARGTPAA
jgi:hypothetical protein